MSAAELSVARGACNIDKAFNGSMKPFGENVVDIYFRTIPNVPPLTQDDEKCLGSTIQLYRQVISVLMPQVPKVQGDKIPHMEKTEYYITAMLRHVGQSYPDPAFYLFAYVVNQGRLAITQMMEPNYKLVITEAQHHQDYRTPGFSYSDILSAGALGLRRAALHFDHTLGFRFSTYAKSWIKQGIIRSFDDYSRSIRLPVDVSQDLVRYIKVCTRFQLENVEEPSDEVVAQQMNVTMDRLQEVKAVHQTQQILSLNWVVSHSDDVDDGVDGKGANFDMIQGRMRMLAGERDNESTIEEQYMRCELRAELLYAMNMAGLTEPEKKILLLMHGFVNDKPLSRAEAGRCCEVDEGQARYLVKRALRKLRSKDLLERLEVYREQ